MVGGNLAHPLLLIAAMAKMSDWIKFNVGGTVFMTTKTTIKKTPSKLCSLVEGDGAAKDDSGAFLVDRDPDCFAVVLNYLRTDEIVNPKAIPADVIKNEAAYYGILPLATKLDSAVGVGNTKPENCRIYRILSTGLKDVALTLSEMSEGWKFEQLIKIGTSGQPDEYICIISKKVPNFNNSKELPHKFLGTKKINKSARM